MSWIRWWRRRRLEEDDLSEELRAHVAIEARQRVEAGQDPIEAEQAARRAFGNTTQIREAARETWGWAGAERFLGDARFGLRMLRKTPGWTAVICGMLALGIGLSTAIFSVVYGVLLQPLPYPQPHRIVALWSSAPSRGYAYFNVNAVEWFHWRAEARSLEDVALTRPIANFNLTGDGPPQRLQGARSTWNLPQVLGVKPLFGRVSTEEEDGRDAKVAILSYSLWERQFGRDAGVLGRRIQLNGEPFEVIGVMPPEYRYPTSAIELWTPLYIPKDEVREGLNYQYISVARMKPGVSVTQAQSEITGIMRRMMQQYPQEYQYAGNDFGALVEPLATSDTAAVRSALYVLMASAGCVLLIGCMNLGILLLARGNARAREITVRIALGASAGRVRRQMLAELCPVGLAGAAGGVLLAWWMLRLLLPFLPANTPRAESIGLQGPVLAFAVIASLAVVTLAGILPARVASNSQLVQALHQQSRTVAGGGIRHALVVAQIAVTIVVLFSGALFARSLGALLKVNPGLSAPNVLTMHLAVTRAKYREDAQVSAYYDRLLQRIREVPGVTAAGIVNRLPLSGIAQTGPVEFEDKPGLPKFDTDWRSATSGYVEAMGIPLLRGRLFTQSDGADSPAVGLIDEQLARRVFGSVDPVGRRFRLWAGTAGVGPWTEIVGVVGHVLNDSLEKDARPQVYWLEAQRTQDRGALVVKTAGRPESFTQAVVEQIHAEDPDQTVYDVRSMEQWVARNLESRDLTAGLVGLFGAASLILACLGLYGVVSYSAGLRLREFGIRLALGARQRSVLGMVLRHAAGLAMWGSAMGFVLTWPAGAAIKSLLFGVDRADVFSLAIAPALLIAVALLAGFGPALRAARTDPAVTLRAE
jgi:putative ABC transport system permease protein